jgi:hypothetical protein
MRTDANVPCNGCTACCQHDLVMLQPDDDPALYDTLEVVNPLTGERGQALRHKPEGGCIYVGEHGCSIHGHAPAMCRVFDCRGLYRDLMSLPRSRRRPLLKRMRSHGLAGNPVLMAGKARLETLT